MGFVEDCTPIVGSWYPATRAQEVEKLVAVAADCGIAKDIKLFDYLVNLVYRGNSSYGRTRNPSKSLAEAIATPATSEMTINIGGPTDEAGINKIMDTISDKIYKAAKEVI